MQLQVEHSSSRIFPVWKDKDSANVLSPYDWCASEDGENPKGLLFVKVPKCGSSTGSGVTLRICDGLSRRLSLSTQTEHTCFASWDHILAFQANFDKRDPLRSFLWTIVREPSKRQLR